MDVASNAIAMSRELTGRRLDTGRRLLKAARQLFVERGYHATRPQDIARAAGVATGTFYLYFADKEAAFLAFAEQVQHQLTAEYQANLIGIVGLEDRLTVILRTLASFAARYPGVLHVASSDPIAVAPDEPRAWRIYDRLGEFLSLALGGERAASTFDLELVSHALCGFIGAASAFAARKSVAIDVLIDNVVRFVSGALHAAQTGLPASSSHPNATERRRPA